MTTNSEQSAEYVDVAVPLPAEGPFTYRVPEEFRDRIRFGVRVLVPFRNKIRAGFVVDPCADEPTRTELREIDDVPDEPPYMTPELWRFIRWIADYYLLPTGLVLKTALPPGSDRRSRPWAVLTPAGRADFEHHTDNAGPSLPTKLKRSGAVEVSELVKHIGEAAFQEAVKSGRLRIEERIARPRINVRKRLLPELLDPAGEVAASLELPPEPTPDQKRVTAVLEEHVDRGEYAPFLLFGVTGSGKTEVYLRAIRRTLDLGKRALVLVPEIALTPQLARRFLRRFGSGVALFHSGFTPAQRLDEWRRILAGSVNIVIAARSGIFSPIPDLGLIVVDEEHDPSYKQEDSCPYNARDMALVRGSLEGLTVILGSATPSFESWVNAQSGKITRLDLPTRHHGGDLPPVEVIDLTKVKASGKNAAFLTPPLIRAVRETLERNEQVVLFLNRRGFDTLAQCRDCGFVFTCPNCDVSLTHHKKTRDLRCHLCGFSRVSAPLCPECSGTNLFFAGVGTQKVEETIAETFPDARIERLDRDSTRRRHELEDILDRFRRKEIDILTGTQMIVKGHDFPGISLVGVLCGDLSLHMPDFRAGERTFQLLTQVSGRTGRAGALGRVIVQTFDPEHEAIRHAAAHAYEEFFTVDSELRRELNYPPYGRLILIRIEGNNADRVEKAALGIGRAARAAKERIGNVMILGPAPSPRSKIKGRHRRQLLLKGPSRLPLRQTVEALIDEGLLKAHGLKITVDVDPVDMM